MPSSLGVIFWTEAVLPPTRWIDDVLPPMRGTLLVAPSLLKLAVGFLSTGLGARSLRLTTRETSPISRLSSSSLWIGTTGLFASRLASGMGFAANGSGFAGFAANGSGRAGAGLPP